MTGPLVSVSTPAAVRGALVGLGGQVDRDAVRRRELEEALARADADLHRAYHLLGRLVVEAGPEAFQRAAAQVRADDAEHAVLAGEGGT